MAHVDFQAFEVCLGNNIDYTGHRVGAINRGRTTGNYLNALDKSLWYGV